MNQGVRTNGWRKICESAFSDDLENNYCSLIKAFANHAKRESYAVDVPNSCCKFKDWFHCLNFLIKTFFQDKCPKIDSKVINGADYVFISLPCEKKFSLNFDSFVKGLGKSKTFIK